MRARARSRVAARVASPRHAPHNNHRRAARSRPCRRLPPSPRPDSRCRRNVPDRRRSPPGVAALPCAAASAPGAQPRPGPTPDWPDWSAALSREPRSGCSARAAASGACACGRPTQATLRAPPVSAPPVSTPQSPAPGCDVVPIAPPPDCWASPPQGNAPAPRPHSPHPAPLARPPPG